MNTALIHHEITLTYPDGFCQMTRAQLERYFVSSQNRWGALDEKRHVLLSVSWSNPGFLLYLTDAKAISRGGEARMKRSLPDYTRLASYTMDVAGCRAACSRYRFTAINKPVSQTGEMIVFKKKKNQYYVIDFVTRGEDFKTFRPLLDEVIRSVSMI